MKTRKKLNIRFLACVFAVVAVLGVGVHFVHGYQVKRNAVALLHRADKAKEDKDAVKEMDYLSRYLGFVPEDNEALARYGECLDEQAQKTGSIKGRVLAFFKLEAVLRRDPERRDVRRRQVDIAMALGKFSDALVHLRILHEGAPADAELERLMGRCDEAEGRFREAVQAYEAALAHDPEQIDTYLRVAVLARERLNNAKKADATLEAMIKANPKAFRAYLARARYLLQFDAALPSALTQAKADMRRARELAPDEPDVVLATADMERAQGKPEKAREVLQQGIQAHAHDPRLYLALIALEIREDKPKEALQRTRQGLKEFPDNNDLLHALADLLVQDGSLKEAEETIARLRERKYAPSLLDYLQARIHVRKGEWSAAGSLLDRVRTQLARLPGLEVQALLLLGQCHERLGNPDQALLAYQQARKLDPLSATAHYRLGSILMAMGRSEEALVEFGHILNGAKVPVGMHTLMARALLVRNLRLPRAERDVQAIRHELDLAAKETPDAVDLPILRAETLLLEDPKKTEAARRLIEKARTAHPDEESLWIAEAQLAGREGGRKEALSVLDRAQARPKLAEGVALRLARLSYLTLPPEEAATADERKKAAEKVRPTLAEMEKETAKLAEADRPRLLNGLADAYLRLGDTTEAERLWRQVAEQQPNNLALRLVLFDLALLEKSTPTMDRVLGEIHNIEGDNGTFWRFAEAARRIQQARPADQEPLSDSARRSLREARQYLIEAGSRRPSWPRIPALEGEIDELEGAATSAIEKYQQALALGERRPAIVRRTMQLLFEQRRFDEANLAVRKLLDQENLLLSAGLGKLAAESLLSNGDPSSRDSERALELALKSVAPESKAYQDHLWLGRILASLGKQSEAEKALRHACELGASAPETWVALVSFLSGSEKKKEAEQAIEQARKHLSAEQAPSALAACYESVGNVLKAEEHYLAALKAAPDDVRMIRNLASFYLRRGQPSQAEPRLRAIFALEDKVTSADRTWARRSLAGVLAAGSNRRRFEEALTLIDQNLAENKNEQADQHARAVLLATRLSRRKEAIRLFEDLARRGPLPANERFTLVRLYAAEDNWPQEQLHMLTLLASPEGKNPAFQAHYARRLLQHDAVGEAQVQLENLEKAIPNSPLTREIQARVLQARGKDAEALAVIRAYAQNKGANLVRAGQLLESLGQRSDAKKLYLDKAEALYRKHVAQSDRPERFLALAAFLGRKHAVAEAFTFCEKARQQKADADPVGQVLIGVLRETPSEEDSRRVEPLLKEMLSQKPDSVPLLVCLADLYDLQGRYADAENVYRQALRKDADNVMALNNLAWLLAFQKSSAREEALVTINKAIDLVGASPELLDTRGVIHLMLSQSELALDDLQVAVTLSPSANNSFHLARALAAANKPRDARHLLGEANKRGFDLKRLHPLERPLGQQLLASLKN